MKKKTRKRIKEWIANLVLILEGLNLLKELLS